MGRVKSPIGRVVGRLPPSPIAVLVVLCVLSTAARLAWVAEPCRAPCRTPADHILVFDEVYYVNAARVIDGIRPPAGADYAGAPAGVDPNSEHPQLAKLVIAGAIDVLGDGPLAWRIGSIVFGTLAILGVFALVRAAGGSHWLAVGAAGLIAADNLQLVHGRIGTLDVYVLATMLWAAVAYVRGRFVVAGALVGVAAAFKEVAPYLLVVFALTEAVRMLESRTDAGRRALRVATCGLTSACVFVGLLAVMERIAPPYDPATRALVPGGPLGQIRHMLSYAAAQTSPHGPRGIASYPWEWLADYKPIVYLYVNPRSPADGLGGVHPGVHFLGMISPPILLLGLPAIWVAARRLLLDRAIGGVSGLGLAWLVGTLVPYEVFSLVYARTSYLYYMVIVMPGVYLLVADLLAGDALPGWAGRTGLPGRPGRLVGVWVACVVAAVVGMYPFTPLPW